MIDIYARITTDPETERTINLIENALGFKLFTWQKTFIAYGMFRQYGATTAQIIRDLLSVEADPLDFSKKPTTNMENHYRRELREIKEKLDLKGIPTRTVFFSIQDKDRYKAGFLKPSHLSSENDVRLYNERVYQEMGVTKSLMPYMNQSGAHEAYKKFHEIVIEPIVANVSEKHNEEMNSKRPSPDNFFSKRFSKIR